MAVVKAAVSVNCYTKLQGGREQVMTRRDTGYNAPPTLVFLDSSQVKRKKGGVSVDLNKFWR